MEMILFLSFLVVSVIQLFYLLIYSKLSFYHHKKGIFKDPISVIICGYNEFENLKVLIPKLLEQEYENYEIVIVNDQSTDETKYLLKKYENHSIIKTVNINHEVTKRIGKKFPLTLGIKAAKYDYLLLTDADCIPKNNQWISKMVEKFSNKKQIVLGYGAYKKKKGILNKLIRFDTYIVAMQYLSYALIGFSYMGVGRNLAYKKSLFFDNKGFSSHLNIYSGDDDLFIKDVSNSNNVSIVFENSGHTISEPKLTWTEWLNQKKRHLTTSSYYNFSHKFFLFLYSLSQFLFWFLSILILLKYGYSIELVSIVTLRFSFQFLIYYKLMSKLGESDLIWLFPILEFFHILTQVFFVFSNLFNRKKNW
tara:strand:+ start:339 stop:1430 length:1092 start_codon:yes stop_codon:yes gene_type:complete